jgi:hypothetical protein
VIYVALANALALTLAIIGYSGLLLRMERRHGRRVDTLLDRLAHATGHTWTPPPADNGQAEEDELVKPYLFAPEQEPDQ